MATGEAWARAHSIVVGLALLAGCGPAERPSVYGTLPPLGDAGMATQADVVSGSVLPPGTTCAPFAALPARPTPPAGREPITLASAVPSANDVVVDDISVYWTDHNGGTIHRVDRDGTNAVVLAESEAYVEGLTIDRGQLYWMRGDFDHAALRRMPASGGAPVTLGRARRVNISEVLHHRIAFDDENVYWADVGDEPFTDGAIYRAPKAGGAAEAIVTGLSSPSSLVVDRCNLYWINVGPQTIGGGNGPMHYAGEVLARPLRGGAPRVLAGRQVNAFDLAVDAAAVYWSVAGAGRSDGAIFRLPKTGGAAQALARGLFIDPTITLDGAYLYFIDHSLDVVPVGGGAVRALATPFGTASGNGLVVDARGVFFAHLTAGQRQAVSVVPLSPAP